MAQLAPTRLFASPSSRLRAACSSAPARVGRRARRIVCSSSSQDEASSSVDAGCARYSISIAKPLGLVLEQKGGKDAPILVVRGARRRRRRVTRGSCAPTHTHTLTHTRNNNNQGRDRARRQRRQDGPRLGGARVLVAWLP